MLNQSIAIVGLGRVGSVFLKALLDQAGKGINIVAVAEKGDTPGSVLAKARGVQNLSIEELVGKGDGVDILFDLTGVAAVRQDIRDKLQASGNRHTVIASESIANLVWSLIDNGEQLPGVHAKKGY